MQSKLGRVIMAVFVTVGAVKLAQAEDAMPSAEEMWRIIQQQQQEIDSLKARLDDADEKIEAAGDMIEAASEEMGGAGWWQRTQLGGYGEVHYNGGDKDQIDIHRFVLFVSHDFNDRLRFQSEFEIEHALAGEGKPGEVEMEQAYIEYDYAANARARAGVFLVPVGILNETHEPPTFFGVERNNVESRIIPTTWWEAGVSTLGALGNGFNYHLAFHSGLHNDSAVIRSGRQKVAEAVAKDPAMTAQIKYTGMPGVELAATAQYQSDLSQGDSDMSATLLEAHADLRLGGFGLRALAARWDIDVDGPKAEQYGWYIEPSYRFDLGDGQLGVFARVSEWDEAADGGDDSAFGQFDFGVNWWLHPNVVLKADYQIEDRPAAASEDNRINLGVGFQY